MGAPETVPFLLGLLACLAAPDLRTTMPTRLEVGLGTALGTAQEPDIVSRGGAFARLRQGDFELRLSGMLRHREPGETVTPVSAGAILSREADTWGVGFGFFYLREAWDRVFLTATIPSVSLRLGRSDRMRAFAVFGDAGGLDGVDGLIRLGLGLRVWRGLDLDAAVSADLTPSVLTIVGLSWLSQDGLQVRFSYGFLPSIGERDLVMSLSLAWAWSFVGLELVDKADPHSGLRPE